MSDKKLKVGSLFSGCGGFDLGFERAGFEIAWANDINPDACESYRKNIGPIIEKSVNELNPKDFQKVNVLTAGFPCQPFSNAGSRRGLEDDRGLLYRKTFDFIEATDPDFVIYENVRGFLSFKGKHKKLIDEIADELFDRFGLKSVYKLLNLSHFGVPQNRLRVVMIASKKDVDLNLIYPDISLGKNITIEKTLEGIAQNSPNQMELLPLNPQAVHYGKMIPEGGSWKSLPYEVLPDRWKKIRDNMAIYHYPNFFKRYSRKDVMGTITAAFKPENAAVWHPTEDRVYSVREIARFQTFPDDYIFYGQSIKTKYQQIGNAVPPLFAFQLANRIKDYLIGGSEELRRDHPPSCLFNVNRPLHLQNTDDIGIAV